MKIIKEKFNNVRNLDDRAKLDPAFDQALIDEDKIDNQMEKTAKEQKLSSMDNILYSAEEPKKETKKVTSPDLKKMKLAESLFEAVEEENTRLNDEIRSWVSEHEQALEDCLTHFSVDTIEKININDIISWISDHDTLSEDFELHFGFEPNGDFIDIKKGETNILLKPVEETVTEGKETTRKNVTKDDLADFFVNKYNKEANSKKNLFDPSDKENNIFSQIGAGLKAFGSKNVNDMNTGIKNALDNKLKNPTIKLDADKQEKLKKFLSDDKNVKLLKDFGLDDLFTDE